MSWTDFFNGLDQFNQGAKQFIANGLVNGIAPIATGFSQSTLSDHIGNTGQNAEPTGSVDISGYDQASWAYDQQLKLDEMERSFNSAEAQKSRDWQEYMSNTSYQRAVEDIRKAGLNPWLALNGGSMQGASTPSGATASASSGAAKVPHNYLYQLLGSIVSSASSIFGAVIKAAL